MAFLDWESKYELGIKKVDDQHHHLFDILNELYDATVSGAEQSALGKIFDDLIDYTVEHFQTEEDYFLNTDFTGAQQHKDIHDDLTRQAVKLQEEFRAGSVTISFELLDFLNGWLKDHTLGEDKEMGKFLRDNGIV